MSIFDVESLLQKHQPTVYVNVISIVAVITAFLSVRFHMCIDLSPCSTPGEPAEAINLPCCWLQYLDRRFLLPQMSYVCSEDV